jgi:hypothetical protein
MYPKFGLKISFSKLSLYFKPTLLRYYKRLLTVFALL